MTWKCDKCGKEFKTQQEAEKHEKNCNSSNPKKQVQEYKRKCRQCGKVWHSLVSREKEISKGLFTNNCYGCTAGLGMCGGHWSALGAGAQTQRNEHALKDELNRLKSCPQCHSNNYEEEIITYDKK